MNYLDKIKKYIPFNEQEAKDKELIISYINTYPDILNRSNEIAHMTASCWIVNKQRTKVLMVYHKIYDSWSWTGGHTDGDSDFLHVALKEAKEETGLSNILPLSDQIFSLESLCVNGHIKKGHYVSSHLHLNVTYLLEADDKEQLKVNDEETKGVKWFSLEEALTAPSELWMIEVVYEKLNHKLNAYTLQEKNL